MYSINEKVKVEWKMNNELICGGCLSTDRKLMHPGIYSDLLSKLFAIEQDLKYTNILLCWECMALLLRIDGFQRRIHRAQVILQQIYFNETCLPSESLSNLHNTYNSNIIEIHHEDNVILETKNELNIKDEKIENVIQTDSDSESITENYIYNDIVNKNLRFLPPIENTKKDFIQTEMKKKCVKLSERTKNNFSRIENKNPETQLNAFIKSKKIKSFKQIESKKRKYEKKAERTKIKFSEFDTREYFLKKFIAEEDIHKYLEEERSNSSYLKKPYKCEKCVYGFKNEESMKNHEKQSHSKANAKYTCNICESHLSTKKQMMEHLKTHFNIYQCTICQMTLLHESEKINHLQEYHSSGYKCTICTAHFVTRKECNSHYKEMHKKLICDHCGKRFNMKRSISNHIKRNHGANNCGICNRTYKTYHSLENHYRLRHPFMISKDLKNENCYCVECDKHFDSQYKYKNHLRTSVVHTPRQKIKVPCPECGKIFSKKVYMNNHFKLLHLKRSKHHCEICDKYFTTGFSLRLHIRTVHDKIALPKNKVCNVCGRGFNTNRTLTHHMRTHTGERPFKCEYCTAAFAQKIAMKSHIKSVHLKDRISPHFLTQTDTKV